MQALRRAGRAAGRLDLAGRPSMALSAAALPLRAGASVRVFSVAAEAAAEAPRAASGGRPSAGAAASASRAAGSLFEAGGPAAVAPNISYDDETVEYLARQLEIEAEVARVRASPPELITSLPVVSLATGEPTGARVSVDAAIAGAPHRPDIVHRVIVWQEKNARTTLYMGKSRAEVRGGGIKPWKQKGTGKARAGSIRSPLWIGGGVAHPPKLREWGIGLQKAVRRAGMRIALAAKLRDGRLTVVASFDLPGGSAKTKDASAALAAHGCEGRRTLLIADDGSVPAPFASALSNIPRTTLLPAIGANVAAIVMAERVFVTPEGLATLTARITQKL